MGRRRDVGRFELAAESALDGWAFKMGAVSQKPTYDETGWDRLVEFPLKASAFSLDKVSPPLRCYFQVKATQGESRRLRVKLSAIRHLCDLSEPAFLLLAKMCGEPEPERAWLIPIDEKLVARVHKRYRQLSVEPRAKGANRVEMSITPDDGQELRRPYPESLQALLLRHVGEDIDAYRERKAKWRRRVGYENGEMEFTVHIKHESADEAEEALVDAMLGLRTLDFVRSEHFDLRFGIRMPLTDSPTGPGWLTIRPSLFDRVRVSIATPGLPASELVVSGELATAAGLAPLIESGRLPRSAAMKARVGIPNLQEAYLDVVLDFVEERLQLYVREEYFKAEPRLLSEWVEFERVLSALGSGEPLSLGVHGDLYTYGSAMLPRADANLSAPLKIAGRIRRITEFTGKATQYVPLRASWSEMLGASAALERLALVMDTPEVLAFGFPPEVSLSRGEKGIAAMCMIRLGELIVFRPFAALGQVLDEPLDGADPEHLSLKVREAHLGNADYRKADEFSIATSNRLLQEFAEALSEAVNMKSWVIMENPLLAANVEHS